MKICLAVLLLTVAVARCQPAQIILLRHGEKPSDDAALHLSPRGEERAQALAKFLGGPNQLTSNAPIAALYATRVSRNGHSQRTGETLAPLGKQLGLLVNTVYESDRYALLAQSVLGDSAYRGKTVVICWTHHELADLAAALGVEPKPAPWKDKTFDRLGLIKPGESPVVFRELSPHLLKGDAKQVVGVKAER